MRILLLVLLTISSAHGGNLEDCIKYKNPKLDQRTIREVASELKKYPKAITQICEKESTFNPKAQSKGNIGLMGVNSKVWFSSNPNYNLIKLGIIKSRWELKTITGNLKSGYWIWKHYNRSYRKYRGLK